MAAPTGTQLHALVFPYPIQGHITPLTTFSHAIASLGISITLVHTQANLHRLLHSPHQPPLPPNMHLLDIPDGLPLDFDRAANYHAFFFSIQQMGGALEQLLHTVHRSSPVSCIISEAFFPWVHDVANKLGIPLFLFVSEAAAVFSICLHARRLVADGFLGEGSPKDPSRLVDFIPGIPPLNPDDLPFPTPQVSPFFFGLRVAMYDRINEAAGVLLNTFYELERDAIDGARAHLSVPIFPIGPLLPKSLFTPNYSSGNEQSFSSEGACKQWLDAKAPSSVLYVSFGSLVPVAEAQIQEIFERLKDSGQPFLWALRSHTKVLPQNFTTQTKGRALVVSWAPQLEVLAHPAVGAFLTHCGWNSTIESVSNGVPMLCWPQILDQQANCRFIVDQWKVGVELEKGREVASMERSVRLLLLEEEGKVMKKRAMELRDAARQAICAGRGDSSFQNVQAFIERVTAMDQRT